MQVVYIVNPINLASLKFSGKFLVFIAYNVHMIIKNISKPNGTIIPIVVALQVNFTLVLVGYVSLESAGSSINITVIIADSIPIIMNVITTCAQALMKRGLRVMIFFLLPARILAIRLVLVTRAPYINENENPGKILTK